MGLFEQDIKEIRELERLLENGKIVLDYFMGRLAAKSQIEKRTKQIVQLLLIQARFGKRTLSKAIQMNLLGDGEAININADVENESIKCPEKDDQLITRAECLDCSGSHHEECNGCEHKVITQNALLGLPK